MSRALNTNSLEEYYNYMPTGPRPGQNMAGTAGPGHFANMTKALSPTPRYRGRPEGAWFPENPRYNDKFTDANGHEFICINPENGKWLNIDENIYVYSNDANVIPEPEVSWDDPKHWHHKKLRRAK